MDTHSVAAVTLSLLLLLTENVSQFTETVPISNTLFTSLILLEFISPYSPIRGSENMSVVSLAVFNVFPSAEVSL